MEKVADAKKPPVLDATWKRDTLEKNADKRYKTEVNFVM